MDGEGTDKSCSGGGQSPRKMSNGLRTKDEESAESGIYRSFVRNERLPVSASRGGSWAIRKGKKKMLAGGRNNLAATQDDQKDHKAQRKEKGGKKSHHRIKKKARKKARRKNLVSGGLKRPPRNGRDVDSFIRAWERLKLGGSRGPQIFPLTARRKRARKAQKKRQLRQVTRPGRGGGDPPERAKNRGLRSFGEHRGGMHGGSPETGKNHTG